MVKALSAGLASIALLLTATTINVQAATPNWDVTGDWEMHIEHLGSTHIHDVTLTQDGDGDLEGVGSSSGGAYEWVITSGSVSGNAIQFAAEYTEGDDALDPLTTMIVTGTIAPNGTMSGTWSDNYNGSVRTGTWTSSGETAESINAAPVLSNVPSSATIPELSRYTFNANATDTDDNDDDLVFSLIGAPTGASINSDTGVFSWTPSESQGAGDYSFTVRVSDGDSHDDASVTLHVTEVNDEEESDEDDDEDIPVNDHRNKDRCKDGGWRSFDSFKNQGQCIKHMNHEDRDHKDHDKKGHDKRHDRDRHDD